MELMRLSVVFVINVMFRNYPDSRLYKKKSASGRELFVHTIPWLVKSDGSVNYEAIQLIKNEIARTDS